MPRYVPYTTIAIGAKVTNYLADAFQQRRIVLAVLGCSAVFPIGLASVRRMLGKTEESSGKRQIDFSGPKGSMKCQPGEGD
jgi:hypothetical protein